MGKVEGVCGGVRGGARGGGSGKCKGEGFVEGAKGVRYTCRKRDMHIWKGVQGKNIGVTNSIQMGNGEPEQLFFGYHDRRQYADHSTTEGRGGGKCSILPHVIRCHRGQTNYLRDSTLPYPPLNDHQRSPRQRT